MSHNLNTKDHPHRCKFQDVKGDSSIGLVREPILWLQQSKEDTAVAQKSSALALVDF